jgi:crotonobetainyl-CoA:carnitine CoA-transferase CaiB-like acyl-CoA transferase
MLLQGLKVLETASVITGPFAGQLLADLGAEVTKVESPEGDQFRSWEGTGGRTKPTFASYNHGKRSVVLDLKSDGGRTAYEGLVRDTDVLLQNFRPGVMERLGLGWERLLELNPRLVYCHITGAGLGGPQAQQPIFDAVAQAMSGIWSQFTDLDDPQVVGPPFADQLTAVFAAYGVMAGVHHVRTTGRGTQLEVSMLSACLAFQTMGIATLGADGVVPSKSSRARQSQSYAFSTSDGLPIAIHLSTPRKFWTGLCAAVGRPVLVDDPRFATKTARIQHYDELRAELAGCFAARTREEWLGRLRERDVPCAPILTLAEALDDAQVASLAMLAPREDPSAPQLLRSPIRVDGEVTGADLHCPALGEHTEDALAGARGEHPDQAEQAHRTQEEDEAPCSS